jgi:hypothetical protein
MGMSIFLLYRVAKNVCQPGTYCQHDLEEVLFAVSEY